MSSCGGVQSRVFRRIVFCTQCKHRNARDLPKKAIFPPVRKTGPRTQHTKNTLILFLLPLVKKVIIISIIIAHAKLRDSFTPTMLISSSGMPERVTCKISGRYVPISPTYDQNEFVKFYNKETHQNSFFFQVSQFFIKFLIFLFRNCSLNSKSTRAWRKIQN